MVESDGISYSIPDKPFLSHPLMHWGQRPKLYMDPSLCLIPFFFSFCMVSYLFQTPK